MKRALLLLALAAALAGCQTTGGKEASDRPPRRGTDYPFEPASTTACPGTARLTTVASTV